MLDVTETLNALSELQLLDSPKTTQAAGPSQSRLRTGSKGRVLFPADSHTETEKPENIKWIDKEMYALVLFLMLHTDGKSWVVHKDMKFWIDAGIFIQRYSGTSHCRTGKTFMFHNLGNQMFCRYFLQVKGHQGTYQAVCITSCRRKALYCFTCY